LSFVFGSSSDIRTSLLGVVRRCSARTTPNEFAPLLRPPDTHDEGLEGYAMLNARGRTDGRSRPDDSRNSPTAASGPSPASTNGIWLAIYTLAAVVSSVVAVLVSWAVHAAPMQIATAGGATFLAVLGMATTVHRFLKDR
jgi:hypothetical protein